MPALSNWNLAQIKLKVDIVKENFDFAWRRLFRTQVDDQIKLLLQIVVNIFKEKSGHNLKT